MATYCLNIAPIALIDLRSIDQFSVNQWGRHRTDAYLATIKEQLWLLTQQPFIGVERPELLLELRSLSVERHVIFYRVKAHEIEVLRILHGRQDPQFNLI